MAWWWKHSEGEVMLRMLEVNKQMQERLMADSEAKTRLLDKIVGAKFDAPVYAAPQEQPASMVSDMLSASLAGEDDRAFLQDVEETL